MMNETIRKWRFLYTLEGIFFILLGIAALIAPFIFTLSFELVIGCLLILGGIIQAFRSLQQGIETSGFWLTFLASLLSVVCGIFLLARPLQGIIALTLLLGIFFFFDGASKIWLWFAAKGASYRNLFLFSGILSLLIGCIIYFGLPGSAFWVIGILVGVNLLMTGISQLIVLHQAKKIDREIR